ncbi:hypothetical protein L249_5324, partial [Ophiocordyceps polyrhachis-furcata BCC 54312]
MTPQTVWHIPQTGEIFVTYEDYLSRMEFYKQRRFNDQITGHSGLSFFEAFNSELTGGREVDANFPEALKGPILRKVQFQTISRLDNLVDMIYDEFKHDFYPGEDVTVTVHGGDRVHGLVRDKTSFPPRMLSDGSKTQPTTRYLVNIKVTEEETMVTTEHIYRDRGVFTKSMLRSFIKKTVTRDAWTGAPWLVKHDYAAVYHIDTRLQAQKRAVPHDANGHGPAAAAAALQQGPVRLPELKPAPKSHKAKHGGAKGLKWPLDMSVNGSSSNGYAHHPAGGPPREPTSPPSPPPPPPPKDPPVPVQGRGTMCDRIDMASVGALLETWDTLNVYCEIFRLDSFTFDDFVEAMSVASDRVRVQLFDEIHCAVLKVLVESESQGGRVCIALPELSDDEEDDEGEDDEDAAEPETAEPTPEPKPTGRATRSSLAKLEAERLAAEAAAAEEASLRAELESKHRAEELLREYDWIGHLRRRDFAHGGWQRIVVGLLHQLSKKERQEKACEELLLQLVPPNTNPTLEAVRQSYAKLDVNYRVQALQILCMLTMETKAVRAYMEDCSESMTKYRKDRIEWQRQRKQAMEELRQFNEERKTLMPEVAPTVDANHNHIKEEDVKSTDANESLIDQAEDGDTVKGQKKRRSRGPSEKQRKRDEEKERKGRDKKGSIKLPPQQMKQYNKLLKEIQKREDTIKECESEIAVIENDLREADCARTRVLGKDRFWNRYYWFERNGMPYGGLPNSSTAFSEYANGCIWVQGPDELERTGYIDMPAEQQDEYRARFAMTIPERKAREEDGTSVFNASQWGYICEPDDVDRLIRWLDPRGVNELKLRKELLAYRDKMAMHMERRNKYLADAAAATTTTTTTTTKSDERELREETAKRTSSRIREKTPPDTTPYRCLRWQNTMALESLGHLHAEEPTTRARPKKQLNQSRSQSIAWLLEELGAPYEAVVFRRDKQMKAPSKLRELHPLGKSPLLRITPSGGGEAIVLAESGFMTQYLCDHLPGGGRLMPTKWKPGREGTVGGETKGWMRCQYLLHYVEGSLMPMLVLFLVLEGLRSKRVPVVVRPVTGMAAGVVVRNWVRPDAGRHLAMLEEMLLKGVGDEDEDEDDGGRGLYLCGSTLSAADILISFPLIETGDRLDEQAIAIFNDVVRPHDDGTAAAELAAQECRREIEATSQLRMLIQKTSSSIPVAERLGRFRIKVFPWLYQMRGRVPRRVLLDFIKFAGQLSDAIANKGLTGLSVQLSSMLSSLGNWNVDVRSQLVLSLCHDIFTCHRSPAERNTVVRELVELWMHISQMRRLSQSLRPGLRFVLPSADEILKAIEADKSSPRDSIAPTTIALAGIFNQLSLAYARILVPPLLATITVLSDPLLVTPARQHDAAPLLSLTSGLLLGRVPDAAYVTAELGEDDSSVISFPRGKLAVLRRHVLDRWPRASLLLQSADMPWERALPGGGGGGGGGSGGPTKATGWSLGSAVSASGRGGGGAGENNGGGGSPSWLDSCRNRLSTAYVSKNPVAAQIIWSELQTRVARNQAQLEAQLRSRPEFFDYWLFVWCAMRRPVQLQETLELMRRIQLKTTVKSYTSMMHGWKISRDTAKVVAFWARLVASGEKLDSHVWAARISALVEGGRLQAGIVALADMMARWRRAVADNNGDDKAAAAVAVQPNIEVVNAVYSGLVNRDAKAAREVLEWAARHGIHANVRTFNILLGHNSSDVSKTLAAMQRRDIEPDAATFTVILEKTLGEVDGLSPAEQVRAVEEILDVMAAAGLRANRETFAKMLYSVASLAEGGSDEAIAAVQSRMRAAGLSATPHMVTILIERAIARDPPPPQGAVDTILREHGFSSVSQGDQTLWERVVSAHAFVGDADSAVAVYAKLARQHRPVSSLACLTDLVRALLAADRRDEARRVVVDTIAHRKQRTTEAGMADGHADDRYWRHHFWHLAFEQDLVEPEEMPAWMRRRFYG